MNTKSIVIALVATLAVTASAVWAQPRPDKVKDWYGHFSASYTQPEGDISDLLSDGYSLGGGVTYWPEDWPIGLVFDLSFSDLDISRSTIRAINSAIIDAGGEGELTGGNVDVWALTVSGTWSPSDSGSGFYAIGGVGLYSVAGRVRENGLIYYPPVCDPWFWWCYPGGVGPGSVVVASASTTEFGFNFGLGWAWEVNISGSQVFLEARYHSIDMDRATAEYLPLTIGFRW